MNLFQFELKAQWRSFLIWTATLLFVYVIFMTGLYPVFSDSFPAILDFASGMPPEFLAAFGFDLSDMFSYTGFFGFVFSYIALIGAIMAASLSVSTFAREKRAKCTDFLLTKPKSRHSIFLSKLLANLLMLIVTNILFLGLAVILYVSASQDASVLGKFVLAGFALFLTQLVFFAVGIIFAVYAKKVRSVSSAATAFGFAGFILSALYGILGKEEIRFIAPLKYFDPGSVIASGRFELKYSATAALIIILCALLSYVKYCRSDAHAV